MTTNIIVISNDDHNAVYDFGAVLWLIRENFVEDYNDDYDDDSSYDDNFYYNCYWNWRMGIMKCVDDYALRLVIFDDIVVGDDDADYIAAWWNVPRT